MISTTRHLEYTRGNIDLGMINEASDELEAINWDDRMKPEVLAVRVDLHHAAKHWKLMRDIAKPSTRPRATLMGYMTVRVLLGRLSTKTWWCYHDRTYRKAVRFRATLFCGMSSSIREAG